MPLIPANLDLSCYVGAELGTISLGPFAISFLFYPPHKLVPGKAGEPLAVGVQGPWILSDSTGTAIDDNHRYADRGACWLSVLLTQHVVAAQVKPPNQIFFLFSSSHMLSIFSDETGFESIEIAIVPGEPGYIF